METKEDIKLDDVVLELSQGDCEPGGCECYSIMVWLPTNDEKQAEKIMNLMVEDEKLDKILKGHITDVVKNVSYE